MMTLAQVKIATLDELTDELAAACWDSAQDNLIDARDAVARLLNALGDLRLYDSDTGDLITSTVTDDQAAESAQTIEGHITVDGRKCYVSE